MTHLLICLESATSIACSHCQTLLYWDSSVSTVWKPQSVFAGDTPDAVVMTSYRPYDLWSSPEVYEVILKAAQDGAEAITSSADGHVMRTVDNVMVRVDVVLGAVWDKEGQISLWPMVNEMDWFNSAGMLTTFWKDTVPSDNGEGMADDEAVSALQQSKGFKIAQGLLSEVLQTHYG